MNSNLSRGLLAVASAREAAVVREVAAELDLPLTAVSSASEGFSLLAEHPWRATFVSLSVDSMDVAAVERFASSDHAGLLVTGSPSASLELTIALRRAGATLVREPLDRQVLADELARAVAEDGPGLRLPEVDVDAPSIIGSGARMMEIFQLVAQVADTSATVLLMGESGTGKELFARALHDASSRAKAVFVAVNCAAIPEHLLESELFGHERGAFTGAVTRLVGRFERAGGGTLFLDEIGDMSLVLQAKVLRALEEREVERLGGTSAIPVDARIIAATNRSLLRGIEEGSFREDLYHRLAVVRMELPPLRERADDLEELALHFAASFAARYGRPLRFLSNGALARLRAHDWPGNVRELRNVMDRATLLARGGTMRPEDLRLEAEDPGEATAGATEAPEPTTLSLAQAEARHIGRVLERTRGHMGKAASILQIHRNTLTRKLKEYGIDASATAPK
jgi:DNA-binding NtrC family response regulator